MKFAAFSDVCVEFFAGSAPLQWRVMSFFFMSATGVARSKDLTGHK